MQGGGTRARRSSSSRAAPTSPSGGRHAAPAAPQAAWHPLPPCPPLPALLRQQGLLPGRQLHRLQPQACRPALLLLPPPPEAAAAASTAAPSLCAAAPAPQSWAQTPPARCAARRGGRVEISEGGGSMRRGPRPAPCPWLRAVATTLAHHMEPTNSTQSPAAQAAGRRHCPAQRCAAESTAGQLGSRAQPRACTPPATFK